MQSPKCGNLNEHLHKGGALELMGTNAQREGKAKAGVSQKPQISVLGASVGTELLRPAEAVGPGIAEDVAC